MHFFKSLLFALLLCLITSLAVNAQTKPVAYRSHSGNMHYFAFSTDPDNLGWVGPDPSFINPPISMWDTIPAPLAADTLTNQPYCNNPGVSKDTLEKNFPFYTTAVADTAGTLKEDTLDKPKVGTHGRHEKQNNSSIPFGDKGSDGTGFHPGYGTLLIFGLFMLLLGSLIWVTNRNKVVASR